MDISAHVLVCSLCTATRATHTSTAGYSFHLGRSKTRCSAICAPASAGSSSSSLSLSSTSSGSPPVVPCGRQPSGGPAPSRNASDSRSISAPCASTSLFSSASLARCFSTSSCCMRWTRSFCSTCFDDEEVKAIAESRKSMCVRASMHRRRRRARSRQGEKNGRRARDFDQGSVHEAVESRCLFSALRYLCAVASQVLMHPGEPIEKF